jgi:uncharacterized membrane protein
MSQPETDYRRGPAGRRQLEEDYARVEQFLDERVADAALSDERYEPAADSGSGRNISEMERIVSAAAGAGLIGIGLARRGLGGLLLGGLGGALLWRGYKGRCQCYEALGINTAERNPATAVPARQGEKVEKTILIRRSPEDLYRYWRKLENLPRIMNNLETVECTDGQRSHWVAKGPLGKQLQWDAEIYNERANELIAWRSLPGGDIETAGSIHFKPSWQNDCTEVMLSMKYNPPAGKVGAQLANWLGDGLEQKLNDDLQRFKQVMESENTVMASGTKPASMSIT